MVFIIPFQDVIDQRASDGVAQFNTGSLLNVVAGISDFDSDVLTDELAEFVDKPGSVSRKVFRNDALNNIIMADPGADDFVAYLDATQIFTNKTLTAPFIGDFTNANHDHSSVAQGGSVPFVSITGTVPVSQGGTGLTATPTNGQLLIGNGSGYTLNSLTGTLNQINVVNGSGSITVSTPQDIHTGASPTFASLLLTGNLTVQGTTTSLETTVLDVEDANISVNVGGNQALADGNDAGITVTMTDSTDAIIHYDSASTSNWRIGLVGSSIDVADISSAQTFTNKTLTLPFIGDFANAVHDHEDASGGGQLSLTAAVTGILPEVNGGTNQGAVALGDLLFGDGVNSWARRTVGSANQILEVAAGVPNWTSLPTLNALLLAEASSVPGGAPAAGFGNLWVRDDVPNTFVFTDDTNDDHTVLFLRPWVVENPGSAEDLSWFRAPAAFEIFTIDTVLVGSSTPSVTWTLRHGPDRDLAGTEVVTGGTTTTSVTTGDQVTSFNSASIPAGDFVWLETTAQSGTVASIMISLVT